MRPDLSRITSSKIREFLRAHPYEKRGPVPRDVEYLYLETISQVEVFYKLCEEKSRPPTQDEYIKRYLKECEAEISEKRIKRKDVANRIARAWATYICELDFYCQVRDSGFFDEVILDTELDTKLGYDLVVIYEGKTFYIHLYFYYKNREELAKKWIEIKEKRKKYRRDINLPDPMEFPLTDEDADIVGNVHLYKPDHVQKLREMLIDRKSMPPIEIVLQKLKMNMK